MATTAPKPVKRSSGISRTEKKYAHITIAASFDGSIKGLVDKIATLIDTHNANSRPRYGGKLTDPSNIEYALEGNVIGEETFNSIFETLT